MDEIDENVFMRKNTVLTGPAGTGKTEFAKFASYKTIKVLYEYGDLTEDEYATLSKAIPYIAGNPGTTINDFQDKLTIALKKDSNGDYKDHITVIQSAFNIAKKCNLPWIMDEIYRIPEETLA